MLARIGAKNVRLRPLPPAAWVWLVPPLLLLLLALGYFLISNSLKYSSVASVTDAFSMDTRRSISYLTCTTSRGSKNSFSRNFGSRTFSGVGFNVPSSSRALAFGSLLVFAGIDLHNNVL